MSKKFETIDVVFEPPIATLVLDRPEVLNAISEQMHEDINDALDLIETRSDVKVIVVEGRGESFCSGGDLNEELEQLSELSIFEELILLREMAETWHRLWEIPKVTIAKVHGYCLAGGLMVASNCDIILASEDAVLGQPEVPIGFNPFLSFWPISLGPRKTKELMLTADVVSGEQAQALGMINRAVPADKLDDEVQTVVDRTIQLDLESLIYVKYAVNAAVEEQVGQMIDSGILYDLLARQSQAKERFLEIRNKDGLQRAIESELPDIIQDG